MILTYYSQWRYQITLARIRGGNDHVPSIYGIPINEWEDLLGGTTVDVALTSGYNLIPVRTHPTTIPRTGQ